LEVSTWVVRHLGNNGEAELLLELRGLKTVRGEKQLTAAPANCLGLGCGKQAAADSLAAKGLGDPDPAQPVRPTPGMTSGTSNDVPLDVAEEDSKASAISDARCGLVELVLFLLEVLDVSET
jgi:hypothetical protein